MQLAASGLGCEVGESKCAGPLRPHFSVCYSLVGLMNASLFGFQSLRFWGLVSQVQVLKLGVSVGGFKPFSSWGEALGSEFSSDWDITVWEGGIYGKTVSQPLLSPSMWFLFLFASCVAVAQPGLSFFSEAFIPYVATDFVCLWDMPS